MASIIFAEAFIEDMTGVSLASKRAEIMQNIALLEHFPEIGSGLVPSSIRASYGSAVRKLVVNPFDIIYEYHVEVDTVHVLGLIHQRAAR